MYNRSLFRSSVPIKIVKIAISSRKHEIITETPVPSRLQLALTSVKPYQVLY